MTTEWTDRELKAAIVATNDRHANSDVSRGALAYYHRLLARLGAVHPRDARERERAAWISGWQYGRLNIRGSAVDDVYPLLTPSEPPPLVLSTGTWNRFPKGPRYWVERGENVNRADRCGVIPEISTASDARALADWLATYGTDAEMR